MLESPLEALAFNYISFGFFTIVNNLWTWIAVVTAAVSFWRIKTQVTPEQQPGSDGTSGSQSVPETSPADSCIEPAASAPIADSCSVCDVKDVERLTKGKFTLYYYEDEKEIDREIMVVKEWEDDCKDRSGDWWEKVKRLRKDEMEWYSYQDLTVINGNIVRLWDECRRRERCYSYSSCRVVR